MKKLHELNNEELKKVFEVNSKLQKKVFEDMFDNADFWNGEYLECWKNGIDYSIGWDRGTYFKCTDREYFIDGLKKAQHEYCFLADKWNEKIDYVEHLINRLNNLVYWDEINEDRLNNRIDELIEELENACYKRFLDEYEYCFEYESQLVHFLNFYVFDVSEKMDNDFYIDEDYKLFEHIEYEKQYF